MKKSAAISGSLISLSFLIPIFFLFLSPPANANDGRFERDCPVVKRANERIALLKTEHGEISAVDLNDGSRFGPYHLQFITLEPNSLFLPVLLHADMVFYIHTGNGRLNWFDDNNLREVDLRRGDIYRLHPGSIFYLQSSLETERKKLRIYALFSSTDEDSFNPSIGTYSRITELVCGFDKEVLLKAFMAPEEVIDEITNTTRPPLIVHAATTPTKKKAAAAALEVEARLLKAFIGGASGMDFNKKKKKKGIYNVYEVDPDFENCNGWSLTVNKKNFHRLKGSNVGFLVVNLTAGSMMGPHWNPRAWEIGIVTSDEPGVVRVGCSSSAKCLECKNWSFVVRKGDVFVVPKFHPIVQMSFNNGTFVFVGFSTTNGHNMAQFFAGSSSVLQTVDREVLAWSFDVNISTIDRLLGARVDSIVLECNSCAEEEVRKMEEEAERERQEEEQRKREEEEREREEQRKREEEEKEREEEEAKREEERRRREEERRKREEEEREREEEEQRRRREEEERQREEEEREREEEEEERGEREAEREEEEAREREGGDGERRKRDSEDGGAKEEKKKEKGQC